MPFPTDTTLHNVDESEANWEIVHKEIQRIVSTEEHSPVGNKIEGFGRIEGKAIESLFPGWKFYAFEYSNYKKEGFTRYPVGLGAYIGHTLAINSTTKETIRLWHSGNYEDYGRLLKENTILIKNADDVRLVWDTFCEIHRKAWKDQKIEKVSESVWKLGNHSYDQTVSFDDGV